ncbi:MAG: DUF4192 domain-containing protein, partial [Marmoricola sp.]
MTTPYVATGPEDLIALAPTVLRFDPEDSVVVMTFGQPGRSFHARVSLPRRPQDQDEVATTILRAMTQNHLRECAVLLYSDDRSAAIGQARKLERRLAGAGIRIVDVLLVAGDRYYRLLRGDKEGTAFDVSTHPFTARRVLDGVVVHGSRAELVATLQPEPGEDIAAVAEAARAWQLRDQPADASWLRSVIRGALTTGTLREEDLPRVLAALRDPSLSDLAWALVDRTQADGHVGLWRQVVRRAPDDYVAAPACLLAFSAWLAGDGALAWCALDR